MIKSDERNQNAKEKEIFVTSMPCRLCAFDAEIQCGQSTEDSTIVLEKTRVVAHRYVSEQGQEPNYRCYSGEFCIEQKIVLVHIIFSQITNLFSKPHR